MTRRLTLALCAFLTMQPILAAGDTAELIRRAEDHYFQKRFRTALILFKQARQQEPENPVIYTYMGDIYLIIGSLPEAEESFRVAVELTKEPSREYFRLGQVLYLRKKPVEALAAYKTALEKDPNYAVCRFQMGLVYFYLLKDKDKTISEWSQYITLAPDDPQKPEIQKAIDILKTPGFKFPVDPADVPVKIPDPSRIPYMKGDEEKEKENNQTENIIQKDEQL